jgi:hypothetical protein
MPRFFCYKWYSKSNPPIIDEHGEHTTCRTPETKKP